MKSRRRRHRRGRAAPCAVRRSSSVEAAAGLLKVVELGHLSHSISPYFCLVKVDVKQFGQLNRIINYSAVNPWICLN